MIFTGSSPFKSTKTIGYTGHITALEILSADLILSGSGPFLAVHTAAGALVQVQRVFPYDRIHGIRAKNGKIHVFGGKSVACVSVSPIKIEWIRHTADWILDVLEIKDGLAVLYAHHCLEVICGGMVVLNSRHPDSCAISAGALYGTCIGDLKVATSPFQQVLVWEIVDGTAKTIQSFTHPGVIFCLDWDSAGQKLCTGSDDRYVRYWEVKVSAVMAILRGHEARIWKVKFHRDFLISVAEDSTCRVWDGETCVHVWKGHFKHLWSLACRDNFVVTGGGDGGIRRWTLGQGITTELIKFDPPPKSLVHLGNHLLVSLDSGVFMFDGTPIKGTFEGYDRWSPMCESPCHKMVAVGSLTGKMMIIFPFSDIPPVQAMIAQHKISSIYLFDHQQDTLGFAFSNPQSPLCRFIISGDIQLLSPFVLPENTMVTTLSFLYPYTLIGTRAGHILLYDFAGTLIYDCKNSKLPILASFVSQKANEGNFTFHTGSRDGIYSKFKLDSSCKLKCFYKTVITRGWVISITATQIKGFFSGNFFVRNIQDDIEECSIDCGGIPVLWKHENRFTYKRADDLTVCRPPAYLPVVRDYYHGLETRCVIFISPQIVCSGGEDGILSFHSLDITCLLRIRTHQASIRCLALCTHTNEEGFEEIRLVSAGARQVLKCWQVVVSNGDDAISIECIELAQAPTSDRDIRIMDVSILFFGGEYHVAAACSDGEIRLYNYAYDKLTLLKSISIEKCVLQAKLIAFRGAIVIVCGATDGLVRIYNHSTGDSQSWKAHDSGIDSMSIRQSENSIEIMTGGDDGAICLCHWDGETHEMITRLDIHGSNVRGVSCQDLFSVSTDQRLYKYDSKLEIVQTAIVDVPDVSSFAVSQQHIAIVGHGMQIIEYI